jgi:putative ABC transport system permease protein
MASEVVAGEPAAAPPPVLPDTRRRRGLRPDRLATVAVLGGLRQRAWSALVLAAFVVLAAACAAGPMFAEASGNAAFQARRDAVPVTARQADAPVVRLSANVGHGSIDQAAVLDSVRSVPGLNAPRLTGASIGAELVSGVFWESTAGAGSRRERARLFAVETPAAELVPVGIPVAGDGLWLPAPVAAELGVRPGDRIVVTVGMGIKGKRHRTPATVTGVYAVDVDGRLPADPPGSRTWALRQGDTPGDTEYRTLPAYLLIGDVATVERLAAAVDDQLLWTAEADLAPGVTLAEARRSADGVEALRRTYASALPAEGDSPLNLRFASGIGRLVGTAQATTDAVRQRTRPVEWAAIGVGLASVLAVALLSARRREREVRHAVAVGVPPASVGGLWLIEHLLPALLGSALGWLVAWQLVARLGPPGALAESPAPAAWAAGAGVLGGLVAVAGVATAAAARRVRPAPPAMPRRALPWGALVVVVALVAAGGLAGSSGTAGAARGVDLLAPLLVLAAAGVIAGAVPGLLVSRRRAGAAPPGSPARAVLWLARRRLGAGGAERRLAVMVVTAGLGMLLFALCAVQATAGVTADRVAVAAGAEGVATIAGSWELDPAAVVVPPSDPLDPPREGPVPGVRTPPLPAGNTVVWRADITTPLDDTQRDLLLVDPGRIRQVALWGRGTDLAAARTALAALEAGVPDGPVPDGPVPVIAVADPAAAGLDTVQVTLGYESRALTVVARVPAFPGLRDRPMYVAPAEALFAGLGDADPRLRPRSALDQNPLFLRTYLWSAAGPAGINAVTGPRGIRPERVDSAAVLRQGDAYVAAGRARGYQVAVAGYLALLAVLTLCVYAQRTAATRRPADLMLARVGLGRARVARARALEFALLAAVAFAAAVAGVAALGPAGGRLLDDQPGLLPRFEFQLTPVALAVTAGTAVLATVLAVLLTTVRAPGAEEDAYRDD